MSLTTQYSGVYKVGCSCSEKNIGMSMMISEHERDKPLKNYVSGL